jgi:hypothetical protein
VPGPKGPDSFWDRPVHGPSRSDWSDVIPMAKKTA